MIALVNDVRSRLHTAAYGNLPKRAGRVCPNCKCEAKANRSTKTYTYFYFACGAPSYKQPRSQAAIQLLRHGPEIAAIGCNVSIRTEVEHNYSPQLQPTS